MLSPPNKSEPVALALVAPGRPQPGPSSKVGAFPEAGDGAGNQCTRIWVPSNDRMSKLESGPDPGTAATGAIGFCTHAGRVYAPGAVAVVGVALDDVGGVAVLAELEHPAAITPD